MNQLKHFFIAVLFLMLAVNCRADAVSFAQFKSDLTKMLKTELGAAQNKLPDQVNILDFMVGIWGQYEVPLFTDEFFQNTYQHFSSSLSSPDEVDRFFVQANKAYKSSPRPQVPFYEYLFAMRLLDQAGGLSPLMHTGIIRYLTAGEGIINMGGCCGNFVTNFLHEIENKMINSAWNQTWTDPSRQILDTMIETSREFSVGVFFRIKWLVNEKIYGLKQNGDDESRRRLNEILSKLETYLDGSYASNDMALGEVIRQLSELGLDNANFRSHLDSFLSRKQFEPVGSSADALAILPHLANETFAKMLTLVASPSTIARTYFHLTEHTLPLLLQHNPNFQTSLMQFYDGFPEIQDHPFYAMAGFGFVPTLADGPRTSLQRILKTGSQIAKEGCEFALGAVGDLPQKAEYHYALINNIFGPDVIFRGLAREKLAMYYANDPEFLDLLKNNSNVNVRDRMKEIVKAKFGGH